MVVKQRCFEMEWAKIHLDRLDSELATVVANPENLYRVTANEDAERGVFTIETQAIGSIHFLQLGLMAGDFICNLRGALDHIAWRLAKIGKKHPSSETCFPICGINRPSTQTKIGAATVGMPPEAISIVKSLQPYNNREAYKSHPLWRLNFLWNANKHRIIGLHSSDSGVLTASFGADWTTWSKCSFTSAGGCGAIDPLVYCFNTPLRLSSKPIFLLPSFSGVAAKEYDVPAKT